MPANDVDLLSRYLFGDDKEKAAKIAEKANAERSFDSILKTLMRTIADNVKISGKLNYSEALLTLGVAYGHDVKFAANLDSVIDKILELFPIPETAEK